MLKIWRFEEALLVFRPSSYETIPSVKSIHCLRSVNAVCACMGISLNWPISTWWCHRSKQAPSHLSGQPGQLYHQQGETLVSLTSRTGACRPLWTYHPWTDSCLVASSKLLPDNISWWRCFTKYLHGILSHLPVVISVYHIIPLISLSQQISVESGWQSA